MKAIILAAGKGKRINSITRGSNKCLLKVRGKTLIEYNVDNISGLDEIDEIVIVVGYKSHEVMTKVGNSCNGKRISYCIQKKQKGLINALESAIYAIGQDDFILLLGDEVVVNNNYSSAIKKFYEEKYSYMIGVIKVENIELVKKTYSIKFNQDEEIIDLMEKPKEPFNNIMGTGNIIVSGKALKYLNDTPVNLVRGEKELVDFLKIILRKMGNVTIFNVGDYYINLNTEDDYYKLIELLELRSESIMTN